MTMKDRLKGVGIALIICLVSAPVAVVITIALLPLWSWLEATLKIESLGHSGPAEWCYLVSYLAVLGCATWLWWSGSINYNELMFNQQAIGYHGPCATRPH